MVLFLALSSFLKLVLISVLLNIQEGPSAKISEDFFTLHFSPSWFVSFGLRAALSSIQVPLPGNAQGCKLGRHRACHFSFPSGITLLHCCVQCLKNVLAIVRVVSLSLALFLWWGFLFCVFVVFLLLFCFVFGHIE